MVTSDCYLNQIDMPELETILRECPFVTEELDKMLPNHKRYLLYWWWAVNVYEVGGRGNRGELPSCIVNRIRSMHPAPDNVYTGFRS